VSSAVAEAGLLGGARNFRAVLPYPAADGRHLRAGMLYRSGELSRLSDADLGVIAGLGIKLVCDLRTSRERSEFASRWPDGTGHRLLDLPDREDSGAGPEKIFLQIASETGEAGALKAMDRLYRSKPAAYANSLRVLFAEILAGGALPLLIHCHAGKDRTGFVTAMLLSAVGISRADIIDDYVTTVRFFPVEEEARAVAGWARRSFGHEINPDSARPLADAKRDYIEAAFAEIDERWGGTAAYLRKAGLDDAARDRLRGMLLV
jgi:protein-tyrosine phosphatase